MSEVQWIKLQTDIFDNRKIKQIKNLPDGDALIVLWLQMMCLAGSINDGGELYITKSVPYTEQTLATQFDRPLPLVQMALGVFEQFGMIDTCEGIRIANWERYQNLESLEKIREQSRKRMAKSRAKKKLLALESSNQQVTQGYATVTQQVTQGYAIDKNRKDKNRKEKKINSISDILTDEDWERLDIYKDLIGLIDLVDERIAGRIETIKNPYQYIISVANAEHWRMK